MTLKQTPHRLIRTVIMMFHYMLYNHTLLLTLVFRTPLLLLHSCLWVYHYGCLWSAVN